MINEIKDLWDKGYSLTQIARYLKTTRNVIAGKMHRAKQNGMEFEPRTAAIIRTISNVVPQSEAGIMRLKVDHCRFILNDDTSKPVYCCEPISRRSYCEAHANICYMPRERRR